MRSSKYFLGMPLFSIPYSISDLIMEIIYIYKLLLSYTALFLKTFLKRESPTSYFCFVKSVVKCCLLYDDFIGHIIS